MFVHAQNPSADRRRCPPIAVGGSTRVGFFYVDRRHYAKLKQDSVNFISLTVLILISFTGFFLRAFCGIVSANLYGETSLFSMRGLTAFVNGLDLCTSLN